MLRQKKSYACYSEWLISAKVLICGYTTCLHYGIMLTIMHFLTLLTQQIPADWTWLGTYFCTLQSATVMHQLEQIWDNVSVFVFPAMLFSMNHEKACVQRSCRPAAWNSSLLMLCSVNQVSWTVTTSLRIRAQSPISSSVHKSCVT